MQGFIAECVLSGYNTEIHMHHDIRRIDEIQLDIDIYFWKYCHLKQVNDEFVVDRDNPYYKLIAEVRFQYIYDCSCMNYECKVDNIQTDRREGHPTIDSMRSLISEMMDILKETKFYKSTGTFIECDSETGDECCVCLDITSTKTNCGHYVCLPCWNQINSKCPMCRAEDIHMNCTKCQP